MFTIGVIAYPIAFVLDVVLGNDRELGTVYNKYNKQELQKLVDIHAEIEGSGVSGDTATMLKGALGLGDALVQKCMTAIADVFWLSDASKLSFAVLTEIFKSGHSRIPIFNTSDVFGRITCVGLLYVKDLILLDPDDEMPVTQIMNAFQHKTPPTVWKDNTLHELLSIFVRESQHLAFVQDVVVDGDHDNVYEYIGVITLEDVIEYVLQTQLIDEHDNFVDNAHMLKTNRLNHIDWTMLHIFDHKRQGASTTLPPQELQAVYHFLTQSIKPFMPQNRLCCEASIKNLLATSSVIRVALDTNTQRDPYKDIENNGLLLYQRGTKSKYFTLLLDGKCEIYAGRQAFRCELSRWTYLCPEALDHCVESYEYNKPLLDIVPDFTAKIIENSRVLRIKLDDFKACLQGKFDCDPINTKSTSPRSSEYLTRARAEMIKKTEFEQPHIIRHLSTPHHITDNSNATKQITNHKQRKKKKTFGYHALSNLDDDDDDNEEEEKALSPRVRKFKKIKNNKADHIYKNNNNTMHVGVGVGDITGNDHVQIFIQSPSKS
eukprot:129922_1